MRSSALLLLLLLATPAAAGEETPPVGGAAGGQKGPPATGEGHGSPPTAEQRRTRDLAAAVWRAVDAKDEAADAAVAEVAEVPNVTWTEVADVLRAGRDYRAMARPAPASTDAVAFGAYFDVFPWEEGKVRRYRIADAAEFWYSVELPEDYDGSKPVPVWFDLGLFTKGAPPGFARVQLNDFIPGSISLGKAQSSMTAGYAVQSAILSVAADLERRFHCDRDRVFCGGFSRFGNAALYESVHWPDLWAGTAIAAGYYEFPDALLPNLRHVAVLAASGEDQGHRAANDCTAGLATRLAKTKHGDVTTHATKGRAVDGLDAPFLTWIADRRRLALPMSITYVLTDPRHRGAYWLEILGVKATGPLRQVVIGAPGDTTAERFSVHSRPASATVEVAALNEVTVRASNVAELRLLLSPALFDLSKPVKVTVAGGRASEHTPKPSIATLLRYFRRDGDRQRLFPAEITLKL